MTDTARRWLARGPSAELVCVLGYVSVVGAMVVLLQASPLPPAMLLLLLIPVVLGNVTIVLVVRQQRTLRSAFVSILGVLLVVSPIWVSFVWTFVMCDGGSAACT